MIRPPRNFCTSVCSTLGLVFSIALWQPAAHAASTWPDKPIRLLVAFPPGGGADYLARLLAEPLGKALHTDVVVENQTGANGNIALQTVARAQPDGYVLKLAVNDHIAVNPFLYKNLSYDPLKDFKMVGMVASMAYLIGVRSDGPATLADLVAMARDQPSEANIGYTTITTQMALLELARRTGTPLSLIPYRGVAQGMPDLLGGRLTAWIGTGVSLRGFIAGAKARGLAIMTAGRAPDLPDIPTMAEQGHSDFQYAMWFGIVAPANTPDDIVVKLNRALNKVLHTPAVKAEIERDGVALIGGTPDAMRKTLEADMRRLEPMINAAGIQAQ